MSLYELLAALMPLGSLQVLELVILHTRRRRLVILKLLLSLVHPIGHDLHEAFDLTKFFSFKSMKLVEIVVVSSRFTFWEIHLQLLLP